MQTVGPDAGQCAKAKPDDFASDLRLGKQYGIVIGYANTFLEDHTREK